MNHFWLLLAFLPTVLHAMCNHVHAIDHTYATGFCYYYSVINKWWRFDCTGNSTGVLHMFTSPNCASTAIPIQIPPPGTPVWYCGGEKCGFNQVDTCDIPINATTNTTTGHQTQFPRPIGVCVGYTPKKSNASNVTLSSSYKYECCQDRKTVLQTNWVGTRTCQGGGGVIKTTEFQFNATCQKQVNFLTGHVLKNYVKGMNVMCGLSPITQCTGVQTVKPTSSPTAPPTKKSSSTTQGPKTSTTGVPGTSTSPGTTTTTSGMPGNMTTMSGNGTYGNTTAVPHSGGSPSNKASPKKNMVLLIVGLTVGVLLLCCLGAAVWLWRKRTKPGVAVNWDAYEPLQHDRTAGEAANQEDAP